MSVIEVEGQGQGDTSFSTANEMLANLSETKLTRDSFTSQATDIFTAIRHAEESGQAKSVGYEIATETYVNDPEDKLLGLQADIILTAHIAYKDQLRLDVLKAAPDSDANYVEMKELKSRQSAYDHGVRDLIMAAPDTFTPRDLTDWLAKGSGINPAWAAKLVAGVAAEVAVIHALEGAPGIARVIPASVEQDVRGADLEVQLEGRNSTVMVDVKYGGNQPLNGYEWRKNVLVVGIGRLAMDGFNIDPAYVPVLREEIDNRIWHRQVA